MTSHKAWKPATLLIAHSDLFTPDTIVGPILDLAGGYGHNGLFLAKKGLQVTICDVSEEALERARKSALKEGLKVNIWQVDLEAEHVNPFDEKAYGGILIFRYLHRPLIPCIKKALRGDGILIYETFTVKHSRFGKPHNPDFLLKEGELKDWFKGWQIIYYFEGILSNPKRAAAQIVCRKPITTKESTLNPEPTTT
jgi:tellurite methyltransferase